jgi:sigma-B regulation protein RsbU (phosphoserine phosphatase)
MGDGTLGIVVGDVSGHGLGAALLMASTRATLRGFARTGSDVGEILTLCNRALVDDFGERFVSLLLARLDPRARSLAFANAGHPTGYVLGPAGADQGAPGEHRRPESASTPTRATSPAHRSRWSPATWS